MSPKISSWFSEKDCYSVWKMASTCGGGKAASRFRFEQEPFLDFVVEIRFFLFLLSDSLSDSEREK